MRVSRRADPGALSGIIKSMKMLITGAHPAPALAMTDEVLKHRGASVVFVGRKHAQEGDPALSFEYQEIQKRPGVRFINLPAGRLTRSLSSRSIKQILLIPWGFLMAILTVAQERPDVVMSFGGYIALPIVAAAWMLGVPVYTHEQTIAPGLANVWIGRLAQRVFVAFPQAADSFDRQKTTVVGNPVREAVFNGVPSLDIGVDRPLLFVTGGSLGSHSINVHIEAILPELLTEFDVVHQTGDTLEFQDYERLAKLQNDHYKVYKQISTFDIGQIYATAKLVVSRAGANTVSELCALHLPSVLIPLPWSARGEQEKHAQYLQTEGVALVVHQSEPSTALLAAIREMHGRTIDANMFAHVERLGSRTCAATMYELIVKDRATTS